MKSLDVCKEAVIDAGMRFWEANPSVSLRSAFAEEVDRVFSSHERDVEEVVLSSREFKRFASPACHLRMGKALRKFGDVEAEVPGVEEETCPECGDDVRPVGVMCSQCGKLSCCQRCCNAEAVKRLTRERDALKTLAEELSERLTKLRDSLETAERICRLA